MAKSDDSKGFPRLSFISDASGTPVAALAAADGSTSIAAIAGERGAIPNDRILTQRRNTPTKLTGIGAVTIGGGVTSDTVLARVIIEKNATAVTATIAGLVNESGVAKTILLTGSTTDDVVRDVDMLNEGGALTVTASVADKVTVLWTAAS